MEAFQPGRKEAAADGQDKNGGPGHDPGRHFPCPASLLPASAGGEFFSAVLQHRGQHRAGQFCGQGRPGGGGDHHPHHQHPHRPVSGAVGGDWGGDLPVLWGQGGGEGGPGGPDQPAAGAAAVRGIHGGGDCHGPRHAPAHGHAGGCVSPGGPVPPDLLRRGVGADALQPGGGHPPGGGGCPAAAVLSPLLGGGEHRAGPAVCGGVPLGHRRGGHCHGGGPGPVGRAGAGGTHPVPGMLPHPVAGDADAPGDSSEHLRGGGALGPAAGHHLLLQCSPMSTASPPPAWPGGRPIRRSTPSSSCP